VPATVTLDLANPDGSSCTFELTEHDTILLGRMADCHLCLPDDAQVSHHHFLLEACPPQASLRDLGNMIGTHINGKKCGDREKGEKGETPERGAERQYPCIALKHGDRITVVQSSIEVAVSRRTKEGGPYCPPCPSGAKGKREALNLSPFIGKVDKNRSAAEMANGNIHPPPHRVCPS
jgi:pSer/pThr/pTyr-binding forkhead associated (FHA) protein